MPEGKRVEQEDRELIHRVASKDAIARMRKTYGSYELEIEVPEGVDLRAAAVTTEPAGGVDQPTGPFALLGAM